MISDSTLSPPRRPEPCGRAAAPSRGYVLVVEADRELRDGITELLRVEGFGVVGVEDGLDALLQMFTGEPLPDVLIFDEDGPGMSGGEFRNLIRRNPSAAAVPLLVLASAVSDAAPGGRAFQKPCRPEALIAAVAAATRQHLS